MKILIAVCLLFTGYLLGSLDRTPSQAQSSYFYGSDGTMGSLHQLAPGGPAYYYDNHGNSGTVIPGLGSLPEPFKGPC